MPHIALGTVLKSWDSWLEDYVNCSERSSSWIRLASTQSSINRSEFILMAENRWASYLIVASYVGKVANIVRLSRRTTYDVRRTTHHTSQQLKIQIEEHRSMWIDWHSGCQSQAVTVLTSSIPASATRSSVVRIWVVTLLKQSWPKVKAPIFDLTRRTTIRCVLCTPSIAESLT